MPMPLQKKMTNKMRDPMAIRVFLVDDGANGFGPATLVIDLPAFEHM